MQQQYTFLDTCASGFLITLLVGLDGFQRIAFRQIDITDSIINLVEIVLVLVRSRHTLQSADHLLILRTSHHLGHGNACIEFQLVGRTLTDDVAESLIGVVAMTQCRFYLT